MGIFDWLFGTDEFQNGTMETKDSKGNKKRVTKKNGKITNQVFISNDGQKHRNEQAMQDYLRRQGK